MASSSLSITLNPEKAVETTVCVRGYVSTSNSAEKHPFCAGSHPPARARQAGVNRRLFQRNPMQRPLTHVCLPGSIRLSSLAHGFPLPAADGGAAFLQDGRGHFLEADHGAELFLDRHPGHSGAFDFPAGAV